MEQVTLDALTGVIGSLGFPIAVAWYSLTRLERAIKDNTSVMKLLAFKLGVSDVEQSK